MILLPLSNAIANKGWSPGSFSISGKNPTKFETCFLPAALQRAPVAVRMLLLALKYQPPSLLRQKTGILKKLPSKPKRIEWNHDIPKCCRAPMQSGRGVNPPLLRSSSATGEWAEADDFKCHPWVFIWFSP